MKCSKLTDSFQDANICRSTILQKKDHLKPKNVQGIVLQTRKDAIPSHRSIKKKSKLVTSRNPTEEVQEANVRSPS